MLLRTNRQARNILSDIISLLISMVIMYLSFFVKHIISTLFLIVLAALVILAIYLDVSWLDNGIKEDSLTEISQEIILTIIVALYLWQAAKDRNRRSAMTLIAGFFFCMLIREMDFLFDMLAHGSWVWFALAAAAVSIGYNARNASGAVAQMVQFMRHPAYGMMLSGLLCVLIFSRLFGMSHLWQAIMQEGFNRIVKNMVEEGVELFGYMLCFASTIWYVCSKRKGVPAV